MNLRSSPSFGTIDGGYLDINISAMEMQDKENMQVGESPRKLRPFQ